MTPQPRAGRSRASARAAGERATVDYPRSINCPHCGYGAYYNPKPVAAAIPTTPDNRIILLKRGFDPGKDLWTFPGGFVDLGESVEQAARREAQEELEIAIELTRLVGVYSRPEDRVVLIVFAATTDATPRTTPEATRGHGLRARRDPMAGTGLLVDDERPPRLPRALLTLRRALALAAIVVATLAGSYLALVSFRQDRELSVGAIRLSVSPGHKGALDIYVPLVDWGARFEAIRLPARLRVDLKTIDRDVVRRVANGGQVDVRAVRKDARDAIATYLRNLVLLVFLCGGSLGVLVAFAVRGGATPEAPLHERHRRRHRARCTAIALVVLLPPRGPIDKPQYYAFGPDIPRALEAVETAQRSTRALDQELDAQLVGLARLVTAPANRPALEDRPRLTLASDLHNNVLALPILERTAARGPVFFAGDLTDRGSPLEAALVRRVVRTGKPFVFVPGNHDSDTLARELARDGAVVLTRTRPAEQRRRHHRARARSTTVAGLRVAGYDDPFERQAGDELRRPLQPDPGSRRRSSASRPGCAASAARPTSSWSTTPRCIADGARRARRRPARAAAHDPRRPHPQGRADPPARRDRDQCGHGRRRGDGEPAGAREDRDRAAVLRDEAELRGARGRHGHDRPALRVGDRAPRASRRGRAGALTPNRRARS